MSIKLCFLVSHCCWHHSWTQLLADTSAAGGSADRAHRYGRWRGNPLVLEIARRVEGVLRPGGVGLASTGRGAVLSRERGGLHRARGVDACLVGRRQRWLAEALGRGGRGALVLTGCRDGEARSRKKRLLGDGIVSRVGGRSRRRIRHDRGVVGSTQEGQLSCQTVDLRSR